MKSTDETMTTKDIIFQAAVELFSQKGYHGTSVRDIARKVGIKESSIYNHFHGKESIMQAILDFQLDIFNKAVEGMEKLKFTETDDITDPVEFWMAGTNEFLKYMDTLSELISQILLNEMFLDRKCRQFYLDNMLKSRKELVIRLFREMQKKGIIKECDVEKTACQYIYMLQGLEIEIKLRILEGESPDAMQKYLFEHITLFIRGLKK